MSPAHRVPSTDQAASALAWSIPAPVIKIAKGGVTSPKAAASELIAMAETLGRRIPGCDIEEATARRHAMLAMRAFRQPPRTAFQSITYGIRYFGPALVCIAAMVWIHVLLVMASSW